MATNVITPYKIPILIKITRKLPNLFLKPLFNHKYFFQDDLFIFSIYFVILKSSINDVKIPKVTLLFFNLEYSTPAAIYENFKEPNCKTECNEWIIHRFVEQKLYFNGKKWKKSLVAIWQQYALEG